MNASGEIMPLRPFKEWVFKDRNNRIVLWVALIAITIQFVVFKYMYPFAGFINGDSFVYLETAYWNFDISDYMVGYSRFLRIFGVFTKSDTALVAFQYLLLQASALYFLFTLFYFYRPGKPVKIILIAFMLFNPLFLHLANYVSSDNFFLSISFIWFALLIWIINRRGARYIVWHTLLIFVAFTVRYNALIYPFISIIAFYLSPQPKRLKLLGIGLMFATISLFIIYTANKFKELTGTWQYSPFSGWQLANNAMYSYRYVDSANRKPVPTRFKSLDNMIRTYFDTTRDIRKHPGEAVMASTVYMWDPETPLQQYMETQFQKDTIASQLKKWSSMAPLYSDYGVYIIRHYPLQFLRYFVWPNANKYYSCPLEFLEAYNMGRDTVAKIATQWFGYKNNIVRTRFKDFRINTLNFYPFLSGIMNVVFLFGLISFLLLKGYKNNIQFRNGLLVSGSLWLTNAVFTIFASSPALRFQSFPVLLMVTFSVLLVEFVYNVAFQRPNSSATVLDRSEVRSA